MIFFVYFFGTLTIIGFLVFSVISPTILKENIYFDLSRMAKSAKLKDKKNFKKKYSHEKINKDNDGLKIVFGKNETGELVELEMQYSPYLFIGGVPGAGKTNLLFNILFSIFDWTEKLEVAILTTPKGASFRLFEKLLSHKVIAVFDSSKWQKQLTIFEKEVDSREKKIADAAVTNFDIDDIGTYNKKMPEKMNYKLLVVDEVQELVSGENGKENIELLKKIVRRGRSSGIYAIFATQYLSARELTGEFLGNMNAKIALRTSSADDSKKILGRRGAEVLNPRKGEALINSPSHLLELFRSPYIKPGDIVKRIKKINKKYGY